jgi:D-lactate dehydrogenase
MEDGEKFKELQKNNQVIITDKPLNDETKDEFLDADIISISIYPHLNRDVLESFDHLQFIATRSTGVNHIDMDYCNQKGIYVVNLPLYGENSVAEHVFALLLTISRHMVESIQRTRTGDFSIKGLRGFGLQSKTIGVIGTGHIGKNVIEIAKGFGMNIKAYDVKPNEELKRNDDVEYVSMDDLLKQSDVITIHVPLTDETTHLLSSKEFEKMKQGVVLINTARGNIIDNQALIDALESKKIKAAGLDVLPYEMVIRREDKIVQSIHSQKSNLKSLLVDEILLNRSNVYVTPHNAFNTSEAVEQVMDHTVKNIKAFVNGNPINIVSEITEKNE